MKICSALAHSVVRDTTTLNFWTLPTKIWEDYLLILLHKGLLFEV